MHRSIPNLLTAFVVTATLGGGLLALNPGSICASVRERPVTESAPDSIDWAAVDRAFGRTGALQAGGVHRYGIPRSDLWVVVAGVTIKPALALGGWIAFLPGPTGTMAMGDLVLLDHEVEPVLASLRRAGISQTAIHHHLLHESPRVLYVHVHGTGDPVTIARALHAALALTAAPSPASANVDAPAAPFTLDTAAIAQALGRHGRVTGGVYQLSIPRAEVIRDDGMIIPPTMGVATAINIQPTGPMSAAITGDFVLTAGEVGPVTDALVAAGIEVTALHNHLLQDEPRLFFMHFWANRELAVLLRGLRAALDHTNSQPAS